MGVFHDDADSPKPGTGDGGAPAVAAEPRRPRDRATLVSAGYVVTRPVARPTYLDPDVFPARMVSASDFVAPVLPAIPPGWLEAAETPHGRFAGYADAAQGKLLWALSADLARFGLPGWLTASLLEWLSASTARGDFHAPSGFVSVDAAQRLLRHVPEPPPDMLVLGLAVREADVDEIVGSDGGMTALSRLPLCRTEPEADGEVLGFDVYRPESGELHSWLREATRGVCLSAAEAALNEHGLFDRREDAEQIATCLALRGAGSGERWFVWRVAAHTLPPR